MTDLTCVLQSYYIFFDSRDAISCRQNLTSYIICQITVKLHHDLIEVMRLTQSYWGIIETMTLSKQCPLSRNSRRYCISRITLYTAGLTPTWHLNNSCYCMRVPGGRGQVYCKLIHYWTGLWSGLIWQDAGWLYCPREYMLCQGSGVMP